MSDTFEGDIIRPLGLVTLHFGYVEYEVDSLLERLAAAGLLPSSLSQRPIGQKLGLLVDALSVLGPSARTEFDELHSEIQELLAARNTLIHGCIIGCGRVISGRVGVAEGRTSPADLSSLADRAFTWKERLWAYRWKQCEPLLKAMAPPNTSLERGREG